MHVIDTRKHVVLDAYLLLCCLCVDIEEQKHITVVQGAMEKKGILDHTIVHGVFVGLARSGKDSLMKRLLGQKVSSISPSTGIAENTVQVKVIKKSETIAANIEKSCWTKMDYDDEAIKLMLISSRMEEIEVSNPQLDLNLENHQNTNTDTTAAIPVEGGVVNGVQMNNPTNTVHVTSTNTQPRTGTQSSILSSTAPQTTSQIPKSFVPPLSILKRALKNKGLEALKQHFQKTWSLYLTNTGGQMEFQEVLPLLVSGPAMFFFTFRLDQDLNEHYSIEYELSDGAKSDPYAVTSTTIEGIMQTLASISAMGTFIYQGLQKKEAPLQPKVFFVGTHKDKLDPKVADSHIVSVDQQLQEVIKSTTHFNDLVEFASPSQLIFTVNNLSESDSDFQNIRSAVERVVMRSEFQMTSPAHWLIFSLALRKLESHVVSYSDCFNIARQCGLTSQEELNEALHFIHSKMGLIRYFPYEDVKDFVIIDPQFLFDKVTELIVDTFTFEKVGKSKMDEFKHKGIFSMTQFEQMSTENWSEISSSQFGNLLVRLRIAAPFQMDNERKLFFPCVLAHAKKSLEPPPYTPVPSLLIAFQCGYCPKGVPGALIKYLMTNEMGSLTHWNLLTNKIFKDQVSFSVGAYDTVVIKMLPTHLEVNCIPDPQFKDEERIECPIEETCIEVLKAIETGISKTLKDLNYIKGQHTLAFQCEVSGCIKGNHPAQLLLNTSGRPGSLLCMVTKERFKLPANSHFWGIGKTSKEHTTPASTEGQFTRLTDRHFPTLLEQLTKHSTKWITIGLHLGFRQHELDNIQARPLLLVGAPDSLLRTLLAEWLQWAPGDHRESTCFATLQCLKDALSKAGLGETAHSLHV